MSDGTFQAVVIGGSAGALSALSEILSPLKKEFPLPVMVVVHLPPDKDSILASLLNAKCQLTVKEAEDKEPLQPGIVYIAPPDYHLLVEAGGYLSLSSDEPVLYSRPSIDVLFESASDSYGEALLGIILTGANNDGAQGLARIAKAEGTCLVQTPQTAYSSAMPEAALKACPTANAQTLQGISHYLAAL